MDEQEATVSYPYLLPTDRDWELQGATVTEPNDQELAELYDEKEEYERNLCKRIAFYDPELAQEVLAEFGLD